MNIIKLTSSYLILALAVFLGVTSNSFAKSAEGFTLLIPSIITAIYNCFMYVFFINSYENNTNGNNLCFICRS